MKIYVIHSTSFDFKNELYKPLRESELNNQHIITLPHEQTSDQFNSKEYMKECDLIIAEVSFPSTGQGIELGWANIYEKPIICVYKTSTKPSGALKVITNTFIEYETNADLINKVAEYIKNLN